MGTVSAAIEIASRPSHVREVFLDFAKLPQWNQSFIKSIEPLSPKGSIEKGDRLRVTLEGTAFSPTVVENSPQAFIWRGSLWGFFNGDHFFRFEPSTVTEGSTTFVHGETFSGPLSFLTRFAGDMDAQFRPKVEKFNSDLKNRVESMQ